MKTEIIRQLLHIAGGLIGLLIIILTAKEIAILIFAAIFCSGLLISILHKKIIHIPLLHSLLENFEREGESRIPGTGALTFTLALMTTSIIFYTFDKIVLIGAIITLTFGDGVSTIAGKMFGRTQITKNKTLEGTIAGIVVAAIALAALVPLPIAATTAAVGMAAEYIPRVNDNYTIPIFSGLVLVILL